MRPTVLVFQGIIGEICTTDLNSLVIGTSMKSLLGDDDMVQFVIIGHARSGSSLLTLALREHKQIQIHGKILGEVFHKDGEFWKARTRTSTECQSQINDGASFIHSKIFHNDTLQNRGEELAVGFKVLYKQARSVTQKSAWDYLVKSLNVRCIHISRVNLLESLVSLKLALLTKRWFQKQGDAVPVVVPQLRLDVTETWLYFNEMTLYKRWVNFHFQKHKMMKLDYGADLCSRREETFQHVQEFLDVPVQELAPNLEKQSRLPLSSVVANYHELASAFQNTPFACFF